ncbi:MAG: hypothetical protein GJ677_08650 [Rhodobacteraceae bacterium]|nr:hypothetical protein [Paracoccaceae bacterium]
MTYRILMMALGTLMFVHAIQAEPVTDTENTQEKTLSVCLDSQHLSVPLELNFKAINASDRKLIDLRNLYRMSWEERERLLAQAPFDVSTVYLTSPTLLNEMPSVLELLLNRPSEFRLHTLRLRHYRGPDPDDWQKRSPRVAHSPKKSTDVFAPTHVMFNNRFLKVRCIKGMPPNSEDEESRWCKALGFVGPVRSLQFSFFTGRDLVGHWPTTDTDWKTLEMAGWAEPLKEVAVAFDKFTAPIPEATPCE